LTISDEERLKAKNQKLQVGKSEIEELWSFVENMKDSQLNFTANLRDLTQYVIHDVSPVSFTDSGEMLERKTIIKNKNGFPKPSKLSEKRLTELMEVFPVIAKTIRKN